MGEQLRAPLEPPNTIVLCDMRVLGGPQLFPHDAKRLRVVFPDPVRYPFQNGLGKVSFYLDSNDQFIVL